MERLALDARERADSDIDVTCGKVGGYDRYGTAFGPLQGLACTPLVEGRERSEYAVAGLGRIAFVRDADGSHPLVAMASLIGKWVRDVLMDRIVRHYREADAAVPEASGYGDPITTRFIEATRLTRERAGMPRECFQRPGRR
jgi:ribonuclease HII